MVLLHWFQYFYVPGHGVWYTGNVWGNVFVVAVVGPLGWLWAKTRFWPLRPIERHVRHLHEKVDALNGRHDAHADALAALTNSLEELHQKHDALTGGSSGRPSKPACGGSTPPGGADSERIAGPDPPLHQ